MNPHILYHDDDILVVDKPSGVAVHPSPGYESGALTEELVRRYPQMSGVGSRERPGVVHRLDVETSGVMVFALTQKAYLNLRAQFEAHVSVEKTYLAVLHGAPKGRKGTLDTLLGKRADKKRMKVVEEARPGQRAVTHWEVLNRLGNLALVEFRIETGRTHQIRVHAAHLGHPIVGDRLYGIPDRSKRLLLHAVQLAFDHPVTGRRVTFAAEPPAEILYPTEDARRKKCP